MPRPELSAVFDPAGMLATARSIASVQHASGEIPWFEGGHSDPWDHIECAMALAVGGLRDEAVAAYEFLRVTQRPDGSWPTKVRAGVVEDPSFETNQCAYIAVGVWHHLLLTGDNAFVARMWPVVCAALDLVTNLATDRGEIPWSVMDGMPRDEALLTGSSSTYHSLRAGLALAEHLGSPQPDWEIAAGRLGHVIADHPEAFLDKARFSMDWYYPVLAGAVRDEAARERIASRWDDFVVAGLGIRCVDDEPWVTGAETAELVMAMANAGMTDRAAALFAEVQHLRTPEGAYWTGWQFVSEVNWPAEQSTWTAAANVLAADLLGNLTPASAAFRIDALPSVPDLGDAPCGCSTDAAAVR